MENAVETSPGSASFPVVRADLLLVHPPAFFDFRDRSDVYFPYLSTSGSVPTTPLYEQFPLGFKTLQRFLGERGHDVQVVNLASVLIRYPGIDIRALLSAVEVRLFGIDLHWMIHAQGALEIAGLLKSIHPEVPVVFGGLSSSYFADELIRCPSVDMVMRGYDTHEPMDRLIDAFKRGVSLSQIPNLLWKDPAGEVIDNGLSHLPGTLACGVDWAGLTTANDSLLPILEIVTTQGAGCAFDCGWCGGSRSAFRRIHGQIPTLALKPRDEIRSELQSLDRVPQPERYHLYSNGSYNDTRERLLEFVDLVGEACVRSVSYEQFNLTPDHVLDAMVRANARTNITLSPESHDQKVSKLAGRGTYSMADMERWIRRALDRGIHQVDVWFFVGMPEQDERSVMETVAYCGRLLQRFEGERVVPFICPMIPILDPASTFFEQPESHGYRVIHRTLEEHRAAAERASILNRINYETRWLTRKDLVFVSYRAVRTLVELKAEHRQLPPSMARRVVASIDDALHWIEVVHELDEIEDPGARRRALDGVGRETRARNAEAFFAGVANQALPANRPIGGRWFDEFLHEPWVLELAAARG